MSDNYESLLQVARAYGFTLETQGNGVIGRREDWTSVISPDQGFVFYRRGSRWGGDTPFEFASLLYSKTGFEFDPELLPPEAKGLN